VCRRPNGLTRRREGGRWTDPPFQGSGIVLDVLPRALPWAVVGCPVGAKDQPPSAATRRTAKAKGGAERNPGSPQPMTPRPNGANGDHTHPVPCALSGHRGRCVAWSPGFHRLPLRGSPASNLNLQTSGSSPPPQPPDVVCYVVECALSERAPGLQSCPPGEVTRPALGRWRGGCEQLAVDVGWFVAQMSNAWAR
jgi:hypothetical protein